MLLHPNLYNESAVQTLTNAPVVHYIDTGDSPPIVARSRRYSPKENEAIEKDVTKMLEMNVIRKSNSPWSANPVVVPKPDGSTRFCTNFRPLNGITRKDKYPLPRMEDLLDRLSGAQAISSIDLKSAYWQLPIAEKDKCKTAFRTTSGLYEYNSLAFGLTNSPATFARFLNTLLSSVAKFTVIYLDDILIFSDSTEENIRQVQEVLRILDHWNLKINIKKCQFLVSELKFLGFIVSNTGVSSNPEKTLPIKNWPKPTNVNELQNFLGICTFYHKFIANLAMVAAPLYKLLKKDQDWYFGSACVQAFQ